MKKSVIKKHFREDLNKEYIEVRGDEAASVPLLQTIELLGLKDGDLPIIRMPADNLAHCFKWLQTEKNKGSFVYNSHIAETKDSLIENYPEIKVKLHKEFKPKHSGYNPSNRSKEVCRFIDNAIILELNQKLDILGDRPAFLERTLH